MLVLKLLLFLYWTSPKYLLIFIYVQSYFPSLYIFIPLSALILQHHIWSILLNFDLCCYTHMKNLSICHYIKKNYVWIYEHKIIIITKVLYFLSISCYNILFWVEYLLLVFWDCRLIFFNFYSFNLLRATFSFCWFVKYLLYWRHF